MLLFLSGIWVGVAGGFVCAAMMRSAKADAEIREQTVFAAAESVASEWWNESANDGDFVEPRAS